MLLEEKNGKLIVELCMTLQALILSLRNIFISYFIRFQILLTLHDIRKFNIFLCYLYLWLLDYYYC